jgi:hypothetical protein
MVTESVMTNNADYSSVTILLPYSGYAGLPFSILSKGAGKSVDEEFSEFSHSIYARNCGNSENIGASLKTESESGGFEWKGGVTASSHGLSMGMSVGVGIENGTLEAFYRNSLSKHTEEVTANGAQYSVATSITPNTITSNGIGKGGEGLKEVEKESASDDNVNTEEKSDGSENSGANEGDSEGGFSHKTRIEGQGKWAEITTNLTCDPTNTDYVWKKGVKTLPHDSSQGMALEGISNTGSIKTIEMDGEASKFPHLHLPPGEVVVTTAESENNQDISKAANDYYDDFSENPTVLYYKIEQGCSIPTGDGGIHQPLGYDIAEGEYFRFYIP